MEGIATAIVAATVLAVMPGSASAARTATAPSETRPRLIVLTDIGNEPDDSESMVRLLLYSNDIDIEGLIAATSRHLPKGVRPDLIEQRIAAYGSVLNNLRKHDRRYPDATTLRSRVVSGSPVYGMSGVGDDKASAASRLIIEAADRPDPRPVWIAAWGGTADLAQALWTVRATRTPAELDRFVSKLRIYTISDQDDAGPWARAYFPRLFWIANVHGFSRYQLGTWLGISSPQTGADPTTVSKSWVDQNIRAQGALGAVYPPPSYIIEGDTPSFISLIPNGLSLPEHPDWGGWGGRYEQLSADLGLWTTTIDAVTGTDGKIYSTPQATIWRWRSAFQNDFAARMRWSVTSTYKAANHPPAVVLNGQPGQAPVEIEACPGKPVKLTAKGSTDPDGNHLSLRWTWYREASGLFSPSVKITPEGDDATIEIGDTARIDQFTPPTSYKLHIILEATDDGVPQLTRYRRAIISVPAATAPTSHQDCAVRPILPSHPAQ